jgi:hypothetical protein
VRREKKTGEMKRKKEKKGLYRLLENNKKLAEE